MDQAWAVQLVSLGYPGAFPLGYDRMTDAVTHTLGELAAAPPGEHEHTFHFVLNNVMTGDNRIPPYGFKYDEARVRNALPVPATAYGNPGPGGTFNYWDERAFSIPTGATRVEVRLYYQQTSWEYVQFLWKNNDGLDPFLGVEGRNLLDAWLNTGMATPVELASATAMVSAPVLTPGEASSLLASYNDVTGAIDVTWTGACSASNDRIVYGQMAALATYGWTGVACNLGNSGTASFNPGAENVYFVIVANDATAEGSYGTNSLGAERPEAVGVGTCDLPQALPNRCD